MAEYDFVDILERITNNVPIAVARDLVIDYGRVGASGLAATDESEWPYLLVVARLGARLDDLRSALPDFLVYEVERGRDKISDLPAGSFEALPEVWASLEEQADAHLYAVLASPDSKFS